MIQSDWRENGIKDVQVALSFLESYKWSSFHFFDGKKLSENAILNVKDFPDYFSERESFFEEILEWISFSPEARLREVI